MAAYVWQLEHFRIMSMCVLLLSVYVLACSSFLKAVLSLFKILNQLFVIKYFKFNIIFTTIYFKKYYIFHIMKLILSLCAVGCVLQFSQAFQDYEYDYLPVVVRDILYRQGEIERRYPYYSSILGSTRYENSDGDYDYPNTRFRKEENRPNPSFEFYSDDSRNFLPPSRQGFNLNSWPSWGRRPFYG